MADTTREAKSQRRAKAKRKSNHIPMAQPDRSGPKGKSLMQIAAERQAEIAGIDVTGLTPEYVEFPLQDAFDPDAPLLTACLYSVSLSMVHFTLDVAVYHQYAQQIEWDAIGWRFARILPAFAVVVYIMHTHTFKKLAILRQGLFCGFSCLAGTYLVRSGNTQTYLAVMDRAPPLGALLIWSFVEMNVPFALATFSLIAAYVWLNGFSVL